MRWIASVLLAVTFGLAGCTSADEPQGDSVGDTAAQVDAGDGSQPATITITEDAEDRLGIETTPVVAGPAKSGRPATLVIPYAAVVYDADGEAWTFASPAPLHLPARADRRRQHQTRLGIPHQRPAPGHRRGDGRRVRAGRHGGRHQR